MLQSPESPESDTTERTECNSKVPISYHLYTGKAPVSQVISLPHSSLAIMLSQEFGCPKRW